MDNSNISYENEAFLPTCSKAVAFPSHWFQLIWRRTDSYVVGKLRFSCLFQADLWILPLRGFVNSLVVTEKPNFFFLVSHSGWKEGKPAAGESRNITKRAISCTILKTRTPSLFIYVMGTELPYKIFTILKDFFETGKEWNSRIFNGFHQTFEIWRTPCTYTKIFQNFTVLPVQLKVSLAQITCLDHIFPINFFSFTGPSWTLVLLESGRAKKSDSNNAVRKCHLSPTKTCTSCCAAVMLGNMLSQSFQCSVVQTLLTSSLDLHTVPVEDLLSLAKCNLSKSC